MALLIPIVLASFLAAIGLTIAAAVGATPWWAPVVAGAVWASAAILLRVLARRARAAAINREIDRIAPRSFR